MTTPSIGFIGFGEAAFLISEGLKDEGVKDIFAYDANVNHPTLGSVIQERAETNDVPLLSSLEELCKKCNMIICATTAKVALTIATEVAPLLASGQLYIDINATSPMVKEEIAKMLSDTGTFFVDAAVMEPVPLKKHKVPLYLSGSGAHHFEQFANQFGMDVTLISKHAGHSSAIKMFRSIFMKGFTMLLLETIQSSSIYGVTSIVMESLNRTITSQPLEETTNLLLNRTALHAERQVAEMDEVLRTLHTLQVDGTVSFAIRNKLQSLVDMGVRELLNNEVPEHYSQLIKVLSQPTTK